MSGRVSSVEGTISLRFQSRFQSPTMVTPVIVLAMASRWITCLVTIHGIGFQEPPREGVPGYADGLHRRLGAALPDLLSDDPKRQPEQAGDSVPIYVRSRWPVENGSRDEGLARLGRWPSDPASEHVDVSGAPLVTEGRSIAHVALVYSHLEDLGPQPEASAETLFRAIVEHHHYG